MATRFGLTWWGRRWIGSLETLGAAYANRLPRGRTYARRGAVRRLEVAPGEVTARVDGSRAVPYRVTLRLPAFSDAQWDEIVAALAGQLRHAAALLDGRMPDDIDDTLAGCGLSLFPKAGDLATTCSCPDHANPCKHVAAVHYVLAQAFDDDPFLLPTLRGRDQHALLAALRAARTGAGSSADPAPEDDTSARRDPPGRPPRGPVVRRARRPVRRRGPARASHRPRRVAPSARAAPAWRRRDRRRAPADRGPRRRSRLGAGVGGVGRRAPARPSDPVLDELRRRGTATARELADALRRSPEELRASLRALVAAGAVERSGHARGTRYHAW